MGIGGISIWQLLIILLIVVFIFGTKRLRGMGSDLGGALKGFKKALGDEEAEKNEAKTVETTVEKTQALETETKGTTAMNAAVKPEEKSTTAPSDKP